MSLHTYKCPNCGEVLVMQGHNGSVTVSEHHHHAQGNIWFCNTKCCEDWFRKNDPMYQEEDDE